MTDSVLILKIPERDYKETLKTQRCHNCLHFHNTGERLANCALNQALRDLQFWCESWERK